jgi:hypothetical protein
MTALAVGQQVAHYCLERVLGIGGMDADAHTGGEGRNIPVRAKPTRRPIPVVVMTVAVVATVTAGACRAWSGHRGDPPAPSRGHVGADARR